jgi:hypothetical protein
VLVALIITKSKAFVLAERCMHETVHACLAWQACVAMGSDAGLYYDSLFMLPMLSSRLDAKFFLKFYSEKKRFLVTSK